jgi:hypothetical protein
MKKIAFWTAVVILPLLTGASFGLYHTNANTASSDNHASQFVCPITGETLPCPNCCPLNQTGRTEDCPPCPYCP